MLDTHIGNGHLASLMALFKEMEFNSEFAQCLEHGRNRTWHELARLHGDDFGTRHGNVKLLSRNVAPTSIDNNLL